MNNALTQTATNLLNTTANNHLNMNTH